MFRILKIVVAVVVGLLCVASMAVLAMRDTSRRPEYCKTCHVVQPYYETWASGDLLAAKHAQTGIRCQSCHPQRTLDVLRENVTNLQSGDTVKITNVAWTDEQCLSCHGDEATLVERTKNLDPNPHAMPHQGADLQCTECHKMHEPSQDLCIQCHTDVKTGPGWTTEVTQKLDITVWSPDMDCATCHSMSKQAQSLQDPNMLAYTHSQQGVKCVDCHTDQTALQQAHDNAVAGKPIKAVKINMDVCFGCHIANQHTSYDQIIERTKDYAVDQQNINPHNPHLPEAQLAQLECTMCHTVHEPAPLINACYGCHHERNFEPCSSCHEK